MITTDKEIRLQVLQMAQVMCDQEFLFSAEKTGSQIPFPTTTDIVSKAQELMKFVDSDNPSEQYRRPSQVPGSAELLTETK
jgi:hypothetical protein